MSPAALVVEDEPEIRELIGYTFWQQGYEVLRVATGEEAIAAAESQPFDVILLDLMLPGLDGATVCRELRRNPKTQHIPIIIVTAKGSEEETIAGLNLGADDYVAKPFSPKLLLARVNAVLRRVENNGPKSI
ncbi:MAG: hypothetical protein A2V70_00045 [Planctomycetes bacterium RBG_13_63_9]|nr:MAG: hypothetical protein A2V70_00045 [Planctomycetes bacterium RBG_13_63_9]